MGTVSERVSVGVGCRRSAWEPGTTRVAPSSAVMPSQGMQNVMTQLCSGNGAGNQPWSACTPALSASLLYMTDPMIWLARSPLPTLTSANARIFGFVAMRSTAGWRPSRNGATRLSAPGTGSERPWMASRSSSISSGGATSSIAA